MVTIDIMDYRISRIDVGTNLICSRSNKENMP